MRTIFTFLCITVPLFSMAQGMLRGKVTIDHRPVAYASVQLEHTSIGGHTNDKGQYELQHIPPGDYELLLSYTGYKTEKRHVTITASISTIPDIDLLPDTKALNEIVVTGVSRSTELRRNPVPMAVVSRQEMDSRANNNIIDAIVRGTPGVTAVTTGPNISKPFIRGLGYNRVLTLYDGIRQEGQQWGDEHGIEIDEHAIERGEVVKGPASLVYGSDATAGVINMIPRTPASEQLKGDAILGYHTNNGSVSASAGLGRKYASTFWAVRGSAKMAHDSRNPVDGYVYNTGYREYNLSGKAGINKKWGYTHIGLTVYDNLQEIPDGSRDSATRRFTMQVHEADSDDIRNRPMVPGNELTAYTISPLHQHIQHTRLYVHSAYKLANERTLQCALGLQQSVRREYNHPIYPAQAGLYVVLNSLNYDIKYDLPQWKDIECTIGLNGMLQRNISKDATDFPIPDYSLADGGLFVMLHKTWDKVQLSGGIRYDNRWVQWADFYVGKDPATGLNSHTAEGSNAVLQFPSFEHRYSGISGSAGIAYSPVARWTIKANIARGYRAPNITETGSNGLDPGAHIVYLGNRDFQPEFNLQEDIGVIAQFNNWSASAELFNNDVQHYIYQARAYDAMGNPVVVVPGNVTYKYQQASARLYGGELAVNIHPASIPWIVMQGSVAYTEGINRNQQMLDKYKDAAKYLPFIPPLQGRAEIAYAQQKRLGRLTAINVRGGINVYAAQHHFYGVDNTETATAGYALLYGGCNASWVDKKEKVLFTIYIQADNVMNTVYQSNLSRLKYFEYYNAQPGSRSGIYNMGRNVNLKIIVPI